ncbi:MAG: hypothetical protein ACN4GZ_10415 [Acidimicrobiales bacterium]
MILELGDLETNPSGLSTLAAEVHWEEADRRPQQLWIETSTPEALVRQVEAFLPACAVMAQLSGEARLKTSDPVSPLLYQTLSTALAWTRHFSRSALIPLKLEAPVDSVPPVLPPRSHGQFFSGGVDSLATLRWNLTLVAPDHPYRITALIYVEGFEEQSSDKAREAIQAIADELDLGLVEVRTNLAQLDTPDRVHWERSFYGSCLGSLGQALAGRFAAITIAPSSGSIATPKPVGSLPQLDTNFSTEHMTIRHPHFETSRRERLAFIADWELAQRWLRPCSKQAGDRLNCGICEKCLPAQVNILALGGDLAQFECFPADDILSCDIDRFRVFDRERVDIMVDHDGPALRRLGRDDLADAIDRLAARSMTWADWQQAGIAELRSVVPTNQPVQVADLGQFQLDEFLADTHLEWHWSVTDAEQFQHDVEQLHRAGISHLAFCSPVFWWFDHYRWLDPLVAELGTELLRTERVRVVQLR